MHACLLIAKNCTYFAQRAVNTDKSSFTTQMDLSLGCLFADDFCYTSATADLQMHVEILYQQGFEGLGLSAVPLKLLMEPHQGKNHEKENLSAWNDESYV